MVAKNKVSPTLFLTILFLVLALISIFLIITRQLSKQYISQNSKKLTVSDQFKDWKTYKNEKYGFELKHPLNYYYQENYDTREYGSNLKIRFNVIISNSDYKGLGQIPFIAVDILNNNKTGMSLSDVFKSAYKDINNYKEETFLNLKAITYEAVNNKGPRDFTKGVFFEKNSLYWNIYVVRNSSDQKVTENNFDQILSTFKFTD